MTKFGDFRTDIEIGDDTVCRHVRSGYFDLSNMSQFDVVFNVPMPNINYRVAWTQENSNPVDFRGSIMNKTVTGFRLKLNKAVTTPISYLVIGDSTPIE